MTKPIGTKPRKRAIDDVIDEAEESLNRDTAALYDLFMAMRRYYPDKFRHWSVEKFKNWNDLRLQNEFEAQEVEPLDEMTGLEMLANRILLVKVVQANGFADKVMEDLVAFKNALCIDLIGKDDEEVSATLSREFDAYIAKQTPRSSLSRMARVRQQEIQKDCGKDQK